MTYGPEFERFRARVLKELVPKIRSSNVFISIVPDEPGGVDVKFAVELGIAVMFDKPIIAAVRPGTVIPAKLSRVVDRFVELDLNDPGQGERLTAAVHELLRHDDGPGGRRPPP